MQNELMAFVDFESDNNSGLGLHIWHPDFRVVSAAFLINDEPLFLTNNEEIKEKLQYLEKEGATFVVYNAAFDCAIMKYYYGIESAFACSIDVWRLASYCNQTVDDKNSNKKTRNTSLTGSVRYFFGEEDFKAKHLNYLIETKQAKTLKEAHKNVGLLPADKLAAYNIEDVIQTKRVYEHCTKLLDYWEINWKTDHMLYMHECSLYAESFVIGICIDQKGILERMELALKRIEELENQLKSLPEVKEVEEMLTVQPKFSRILVKKHKEKFPEKWYLTEPSEEEIVKDMRQRVDFNFNSVVHKKMLFIDILKLPVIKYTPHGAPEISKKTLHNYGPIGKTLTELLKWKKAYKEMETLKILSSIDGHFHPMLRSSTTVSGRSSSSME